MKMLSMEPDEHMRWIYDSTHQNYDREHAEYLRARRAAAIRSAPRWMLEEARLNDILREQTPNVVIQGPPAGGPTGMESSTT